MNRAKGLVSSEKIAFDLIHNELKSLSIKSALEVISRVLSSLVMTKTMQDKALRFESNRSVFQLRKQGGVSFVKLDPELEEYILSLEGYKTILEIRFDCIQKFGEKRTPSKSAIHRYIQKLQYRGKGNKHVE